MLMGCWLGRSSSPWRLSELRVHLRWLSVVPWHDLWWPYPHGV